MMVSIYLNIYFMLILSVLFFFMSIYFLIKNLVLFLEMEMLKLISIKLEYLILIDWVFLLFISVVLFISFLVIFYSIEYMSLDLNMMRFMILINLFVISMILMVMSPNMISILLGWDGLGLVSYCLVIYYQNENSFNSGMVTVLTNRIGDIMILMLIGLLMSKGSWSFLFFNYMNKFLLLLVMIVAFTKSAQIPFSSWLPMAMAAPTPISSLVHSSTLVTAGVYLLIRFNYLMLNTLLLKLMMFFSIMTLFMSGLSANLENDLKKIIALSTLSQLGVMIFCLSMGLSEVSFFHLLTHAMFKSMLFMCAGVIIHNMLGNQDIRYISMVLYNLPLVSVIFCCSTFSLCGLPFLSGFFSKDMILEMYMMSLFNRCLFIILFISMGFTVMYSFRLIYYSFIKFPKINIFNNYKSLSSLMVNSMIFLYIMTIIMGSMLSWFLFSMKNMIYLTISFKMMIYFFMIMGMLIGLFSKKLFFTNFFIKMMNFYLKFFFMMWFMFMFYGKGIFKAMKLSENLIFLVEMGWNEYIMGWGLLIYLKKIFFLDLYKKNFFTLLIFIMYMMMMLFY